MNDLLYILIIIMAAIAIGVVAGNGAVYFFNKMPAEWLQGCSEKPDEWLQGCSEKPDEWLQGCQKNTQRIKSHPWKQVFTASFIIIGIYMGTVNFGKDMSAGETWQYAIAGVVACWFLLLLGLAAKKYKVLPDWLLVGLAVTACGFIPIHHDVVRIILGAAVGCIIGLSISLFIKLISKKEKSDFGEVKLCAVLGLLTGMKQIVIIAIVGLAITGIYEAVKILKSKREKRGLVAMKKDEVQEQNKIKNGKAFATCVCAIGAAYIIILHNYF